MSPRPQLLQTSIHDLGLSVRALNVLCWEHRLNMRTLGDMVGLTAERIMLEKNAGEGTAREILAVLDKFSLGADRCALCDGFGWTLRQEVTRPLALTWGTNTREGREHVEYHAPCGCAYHPEPKPHVHPCADHR